MREIRLSGSEGGVALIAPSLPLSLHLQKPHILIDAQHKPSDMVPVNIEFRSRRVEAFWPIPVN